MNTKGLMNVRRLSTTFLLLGLLVFGHARPYVSREDGKPLEFPYEVRYDEKTGLGGPIWTALVVLPDQFYSRDNLERLFRYWSTRHPNKQERLLVNVFVATRAPDMNPVRSIPMTPTSRSPDAVFTRKGDGAASGGGDNESFTYAPDPSKPDERSVVVLKGGRGFGPKTVLETWTSSLGSTQIRLRSYELASVEPTGVYYTFDTGGSDYDDRAGIMTIRLDKRIPLPTDHVRVVNENVTYFFLGWKFAVTIDRGKKWSAWDVVDNTSLTGVIDDVVLRPDGIGHMAYRVYSKGEEVIRRFHTEDFGLHWTID